MRVLEKEYVGKIDIKGKVDITDPCYDKDVWCRMNAVPVLAGKWKCNIWQDKVENRVAIIGICHEKYVVPKQKDMKKIGEIGVDAGVAGFFHNKPDFDGEKWQELCKYMRDGDRWLTELGFWSDSGYGDGSYPVYAKKNSKGEITALEIRFL